MIAVVVVVVLLTHTLWTGISLHLILIYIYILESIRIRTIGVLTSMYVCVFIILLAPGIYAFLITHISLRRVAVR